MSNVGKQSRRDETGVALYRHEAIGAVFQIRKINHKLTLSVLVTTRTNPPFAGLPALPSGPVETDESLAESVLRHLAEKLDISGLSHLEQLETNSDPTRDPAQRTIATSYLGIVPTDLELTLPDPASWIPAIPIPQMAFDHSKVIASAIERLRAKLSYTNIGFALAPTQFTIADLAQIYVAALGHDVSPTNLQRVLSRRGQLKRIDQVVSPGAKGGRPARMFCFTSNNLVVTDPFAVLRPEE